MKARVCSVLNIMTKALNDKYRGMPATLGMDKSDRFQYLIERLILRLTGWKENFDGLSCGSLTSKYRSSVSCINKLSERILFLFLVDLT